MNAVDTRTMVVDESFTPNAGTTMPTEKVRLVIQTDDELRQALKLEALEQGVDMSELADSILRAALTAAIARVRERKQGKGKKKE